MKYIKLFMLMVACCLISCGGGEDDGGGTISGGTFEISESDLTQNVGKSATTLYIPVKTDLLSNQWSVESDAIWCKVGKSSDGKNITVMVDPSEEIDVRTAKVTVIVTSPQKSFTITVKQLGYGPAILLKSIPNLVQKISAEGGKQEIVVTTNIDYTVTSPQVDWVKEMTSTYSTRGFVDYSHRYDVEKNLSFDSRSTTITFSDNRKNVQDSEKAKSVTLELRQEALDGKPSDVDIEGDIKLKVIGGQANQEQSGANNELKYSYDGKMDTHYHSPWYANTKWPVILEYYFDGTNDLDYIIYHSRNGNGNFGQFKLYVATKENSNYEFVGEHDLKCAGGSSRISLPESVQGVTKVKFEVLNGSGDGTGNTYASCAEMEFYQINTEKSLDAQLRSVFTDLTCSALKDGVTEGDINQLPEYFCKLAIAIRDGVYSDYEKEFRIQEYKAHSNPAVAAEKFMIKKYSMLDNPTGITVKANDEVILLVGDTYGHDVSVHNVGEEQTNFGESHNYPQTEATGDPYFLQPGVNKIKVQKTGMLFIVYHADLATNPKPIKIHIPIDCGQVAGYWDLEKHKTNEKYKELIGKSTYKYFCVRGERMIFYFHRDKMMAAVPEDINSAISLWDDIVRWQHELMGFDDVFPAQMNNHLFAISPEGSYMWADHYRVAFVYTYLNNILLKDNVMAEKDNAWGPAHEIGHIHQKAINWPSCSESSNNLFSNLILYKLGKYCSRGRSLDKLARARFVDGNSWSNLGEKFEPAYQGEAPDLHLRMHWQLFNYYHRCGYMPDFWPKMFKALRETRIVESDPGAGQLLFAKTACKVANEDLTEFFEMWGFFEPVNNVKLEQYGTWNYNVTQAMIDDAKAYMATFPKKAAPIQYLEDRKSGDVGLDVDPGDVGYYTQFIDNQKITKTITHTRSGQTISVKDGDEAVAFELYKGDKLVYFSNKFNFSVPSAIGLDDSVVVKAVQADGVRVEVK